MSKIDFVILWVDGSDPKWLEEKERYLPYNKKGNSNNRYRDWDLLRYWFRGIEKYANWVNKIHFVTYGHIPSWLDTNNPKINIVKHSDIIPEEYLPTYNSNVIQFYLKNIKGLSDNFVMFDDDMFIIDSVKETDFFIGDKIRDEYAENVIIAPKDDDTFTHSMLNNMSVVNKYYNKRKVYKKHPLLYFNIKYGFKNLFKTIILSTFPEFIGIYNPHVCQCYTKKHFELFWKYNEKSMDRISQNRFRNYSDLTTFLVRYIALLEGDFIPRKKSFSNRFELSDNNEKVYKAIEKRKYKIICINDSADTIDFEKTKKELINSFEKILSEKSSFEI